MEVEDRLTIATPEGVQLELTLAGLGSRMLAGTVDLTLKLLMIVVLALALEGIGDVGAALFAVAAFAVLFFYDVLFEVLGGGRTPGKRWNGLRVVRTSGRPVDTRASCVRNLLRLIDGLPLSYLPTIIGIVVTRRNQRVGDLAADTIVVRERRAAARELERAGGGAGAGAPSVGADGHTWAFPPPLDAGTAAWDVSAVTRDELAAARAFLARHGSFDAGARAQVAAQLAGALRTRVGGADERDDERFLERLVAAKDARAGTDR